MNIYRQGDILIVEVEPEQVSGKQVKRDGKRIILAYGEVTGHAHAITAPSVKLLETEHGERFLTSVKPFVIKHEEHAEVSVPAGMFRVIRQREYSPERIRTVAD